MSTIITRSTGSSPKGAPLTAGELDANFINLNADKVESTRAINTTAGDLTGGGDLSGDRTLGLASTGISAGTVQNSATQVTPLTLDIKGRVTAVGTPVTIAPDFSNVANKPTTLSGYGITDAQATITGAATTIDTEDLTASKVLISNGSGKVAASDVSTTTLGYLDATSSVQGQLDAKQATTAKNAANGYAGLDANAKLPTSLLPALAISEYLGSVANQAARLALTGEKGDWCSQANDGKVYVITGDDPTDNANWTALTYPVTPGITLNGTSIAPGDTATITAATTNTLTIGTGLSGTSFDGSAATTIAIDSSVVTLTGTQTLTNKTLTSPAINGGTANNVAIGGTTPAAGAFTTLSASSTVSGSGFSTYLASPPAIGGSSPAAGNFTTLGATGAVTLSGGTANGVAYLNGSKVLTTGSGLTFDGTNLGVGVASPGYKLDVSGAGDLAARVNSTGTANAASIILQSGNGTTSGLFSYARFLNNDTNGQDWRIGTYGTNNISIVNAKAGTVPFVLDTSGNLGIGYTSLTGLGSNGLAVAGNVGIGTSSPGAKLGVTSPAATSAAAALRAGSTDSVYMTLGRNAYEAGIGVTGSTVLLTGSSAGDLNIYTNTSTSNIRFSAGNTGLIQATLDSSGNLGLGVTPSAWSGLTAIQVKSGAFSGNTSGAEGLYITSNTYYNSGFKYIANDYATKYEQGTGTHTWFTAPSGNAGDAISFVQAMTLDSSGNLLVTQTSASYTTLGASIRANGAVNSASASDFWNSYSTAAGAYRFYVTNAGTVYATNTTIAAISDQRLKENIRDLDDGLSTILSLKPRKFDWKEGKGKDVKDDRGFIAQEFEQVFPDLIDTWKDEPPAGEEPYKAVRADLIPVLVKAIQELHAEIEQLKQKVNA